MLVLLLIMPMHTRTVPYWKFALWTCQSPLATHQKYLVRHGDDIDVREHLRVCGCAIGNDDDGGGVGSLLVGP